jgi:hypothetical protein
LSFFTRLKPGPADERERLGCRNQRKKKALQDTKVKCEQLLSENRLLLEEREANQQETYEVCALDGQKQFLLTKAEEL